ncbi:MAG: thioredoxin [Marinilabiliaceae bacterium]|nr:thioredoxin [Marinilabiliaceae bacterium]
MLNTLIAIGTALIIFVAYVYIKVRKMKNMPTVSDSEKITTLTDKNFQHKINNGIMLVDFWASWCMPCKLMTPVLNDLAEDPSVNGTVAKLNIEQYQSVAAKYNVRSIPTMVLFKNGKEVNRFIGVKSKDFLLKQMKIA